jgi:hypothetical protein
MFRALLALYQGTHNCTQQLLSVSYSCVLSDDKVRNIIVILIKLCAFVGLGCDKRIWDCF